MADVVFASWPEGSRKWRAHVARSCRKTWQGFFFFKDSEYKVLCISQVKWLGFQGGLSHTQVQCQQWTNYKTLNTPRRGWETWLALNLQTNSLCKVPLWNKMLVVLCWWDGRTKYKALCWGKFPDAKKHNKTISAEKLVQFNCSSSFYNRTDYEKTNPNEREYSLFLTKDDYCVVVTRVCYFLPLFLTMWGSWLPMQGRFNYYLCHYHTIYTVYISILALIPVGTKNWATDISISIYCVHEDAWWTPPAAETV